jgi:peptide/nickel transport system substrate-binding protein
MTRTTHFRTKLSMALSIGVVAVAFSAIGLTGVQYAGAQGTGSTVTLGWAEEPDTLNPAATGARDVGPIDANIFDTLVYLTKSLQPTPDLATSWKISDSGKLYTFQLRHGVKFQDGTPFNAQAVVANFKYITAKTTQAATSITLLGSCTTAVAQTTYEVEVRCAQPYAPFLTQLGQPYLGIQSPTAITKYGKNLGSHPVGTGPFEFVSFTPNQSVVLKQNPAYDWAPAALHHQGPASLSRLVFDIVPTDQSRVSEFTSGQSQFMQETPGIYFQKFKGDSSYTESAVPISGMGIFLPINTSLFPTNELAVRQAILYSVNESTVVQVADDGAYTVLHTPLEPGMLGYQKSVADMYPYDPAKAKQLLTSAGWKMVNGIWTKGGRQLTVNLTTPTAPAEYPLMVQGIQAQLQKVGMNAKVITLSTTAWLASAAAAGTKGSTSLTPSQYVAVDSDGLSAWFLPAEYLNWSHYTNPTLTELLEQGRTTTSTHARAVIYQETSKLIMQQALMMPMHENQDLTMMSSKLKGVTYEGGGFELFHDATLSS